MDSLLKSLKQLPLSTILYSLPVFSLLICSTWISYTLTLHPLAKIPGPVWARLSRTWYMLQIYRGDSDHSMRQLHARHGPVVRIAPDEVSIADPAAISRIYDARGTYVKTDLYDTWEGNISKYRNLFSMRDEALHTSRRKIVSQVYSMTAVLESEKYIDQVTTRFIQRMDEFSGAGTTLDISKWLEMYAADVIGELVFGKSLGCLDQSPDVQGYLSSRDALLRLISTLSVTPSYARALFIPLALLSSEIRVGFKAFGEIVGWSKRAVAQRHQMGEAGNGRVDMMDKFYRIVAEKGQRLDFGEDDVGVEVAGALQAGADTTSIAMTAVLYYLMKNPKFLRKLKAELDSAVASVDASPTHISYRDAVKLPYLDACIKEGMRLHPSLGVSMPRHVPSEGAELAGFFFPAGIKVGVNAAVVHYDREVFGKDAHTFNPERWITADKSKMAQMDRTIIVFGAGTRTCIGQNISICEIYKLLLVLLRDFDIELVSPGKDWKTTDWWFNKASEVNVRVRRRK